MKNICIQNGTIIDGNGAVIKGASIFIEAGIIEIMKEDKRVYDAETVKIIDAKGLTILPGFINTHVHAGFKYVNNEPFKGFQKDYLSACICEGVTTIRDEGMFTDHTIEDVIYAKKEIDLENKYPRIVTTGKFFSAPKGYGGKAPITIEKISEIAPKIDEVIDQGIDMIKTVLEDGLDPSTFGLPQLSQELLQEICKCAHDKGVKVSAHVTQAHNLRTLVDSGIDDAGHMVYDDLSDELIHEMVEKQIIIVPTLTVSKMINDKYGAPVFESTKNNVFRFVEAGGKIAMGDDYIEAEAPWYRMGMPTLELKLLKEAGLSNMQIITAATKNGAQVCGMEKLIGTIETGKKADLFLVEGNPLEDLECLSKVKLVIKDGSIMVNHIMG